MIMEKHVVIRNISTNAEAMVALGGESQLSQVPHLSYLKNVLIWIMKKMLT